MTAQKHLLRVSGGGVTFNLASRQKTPVLFFFLSLKTENENKATQMKEALLQLSVAQIPLHTEIHADLWTCGQDQDNL